MYSQDKNYPNKDKNPSLRHLLHSNYKQCEAWSNDREHYCSLLIKVCGWTFITNADWSELLSPQQTLSLRDF